MVFKLKSTVMIGNDVVIVTFCCKPHTETTAFQTKYIDCAAFCAKSQGKVLKQTAVTVGDEAAAARSMKTRLGDAMRGTQIQKITKQNKVWRQDWIGLETGHPPKQ